MKIAAFLQTEIVNADSRQFYRGMDIGTAKPTPVELSLVKHHFIDILSPEEDYTVGTYEHEALKVISEIFRNHDQAILVGGSGLYLQAVCEGLDELPPASPEIRSRLQKNLKEQGIVSLQNELETLDPEYYKSVDRNNPHRLIRAIEVCILSGKKYSALRKSEPKKRPFEIIKIGIRAERNVLYERINKRVDEMINAGLVEEARNLLPLKKSNALQTVGYQELFSFFEGKYNLEHAISEIRKNTRRYAKRQLTWFKKDLGIHWFPPDHDEDVLKTLHKMLS